MTGRSGLSISSLPCADPRRQLFGGFLRDFVVKRRQAILLQQRRNRSINLCIQISPLFMHLSRYRLLLCSCLCSNHLCLIFFLEFLRYRWFLGIREQDLLSSDSPFTIISIVILPLAITGYMMDIYGTTVCIHNASYLCISNNLIQFWLYFHRDRLFIRWLEFS